MSSVKPGLASALLLAATSLLFPLTALPEEPDIPSLVRFDNPAGTVIFNHADHAGRLDCRQCHFASPPEKILVNMTFAHNTCRGCHTNVGSGPTACEACHIKNSSSK